MIKTFTFTNIFLEKIEKFKSFLLKHCKNDIYYTVYYRLKYSKYDTKIEKLKVIPKV